MSKKTKSADGVFFEAKWSQAAKNKSLIRITEGDKKIIFSLNDFIGFVASHYNSSVTAPMIVNNDMVQLVEVMRQLKFKADRDIKEGEEFNVNFTHVMPIEYAVAEHALNLCKINGEEVKVETITKEAYEKMAAEVNSTVMDQTRRLNMDVLGDDKTTQS